MTQQFAVTLDLDADGFLRRGCPQCEREFKWLSTETGEAPESYYCPYCAHPAATDQWFTEPQAAYLRAAVHKTVVEPLIDDLQRGVDDLKIDAGLIKIRVELNRSPAPKGERPTEPNDMRRVAFGCHPDEPLKVLDTWREPVHCLICGLQDVAT